MRSNAERTREQKLAGQVAAESIDFAIHKQSRRHFRIAGSIGFTPPTQSRGGWSNYNTAGKYVKEQEFANEDVDME